MATAVAQTVYSVNAVGYVNVTVPAGNFALLANPLNQPTNSLSAVLPSVPVGTDVYIWNGSSFDKATSRATGWTGTGAAEMINPGQGFFVKNNTTAAFTVTFVGDVPQGTNLTVAVPVGFSVLASIVPQTGKISTDLGFPTAVNDQVYLFDPVSSSYLSAFTKRATSWTGGDGSGEPTIAVGTSFFYNNKNTAGNWTRNFTVNQ